MLPNQTEALREQVDPQIDHFFPWKQEITVYMNQCNKEVPSVLIFTKKSNLK